jgi:4-amino-4-deoxy-L-arabinose transferase-like glycosyltransferase
MPAAPYVPSSPVANARTALSRRVWLLFAGVGILSFFLFFFQLGDRDLASSHEARAGQDAQSMLCTGQWDLPRLFDGSVEMQKPPLYYWLVAVLGALNGEEVNAWSVRLPSAIAAWGCVLILLAWGIRRERPLAGFVAAIILATSLHFTSLARIGRIDMPLTLTVCLTLVSFCEGNRKRRGGGNGSYWRWFLLGYLTIAAGILLKGPIAIALPLVAGIIWWTYRYMSGVRRPASGVEESHPDLSDFGLRTSDFGHCFLDTGRRTTDSGLIWGLPLILILTVPWFLWANYRTEGEFFRVFFWHHNIDRGFGTEDTLRAYPWWYYGPQMLIDLLPWSLLLPGAVLYLWRRRDEEARFGACWFLSMLLLLSCMRFKRSDYLLPAFPGIAWTLGCVAERWYLTRHSRRLVGAFAAMAGITVSLWLSYITVLSPSLEASRTHRHFAEEVRKSTSKRVLFFWAEAHLLAFHIGQPLSNFVEWDRLDAWAGLPESTYVIMPVYCYRESPKYLTHGTLEAVAYSTEMQPPSQEHSPLLRYASKLGMDVHERAYVLVRTHNLDVAQKDATGSIDATLESDGTRTGRAAAHRISTAELDLDRLQCGNRYRTGSD